MSNDPVDYSFSCLDTQAPSGKIYLPSSVHLSVIVGARSTVWRYTTILEDTEIGEDCVVGTGVFIGRHCRLGNEVRIHPNAAIPDGTIIGDDVFIGASVTLTDVKYPNVRHKAEEVHLPPVILAGAIVNSNAVILPGILIGRGAVVGAGAVVTKDVPDGRIVVGNPARYLTKARPRRVVLMNEEGEVADG